MTTQIYRIFLQAYFGLWEITLSLEILIQNKFRSRNVFIIYWGRGGGGQCFPKANNLKWSSNKNKLTRSTWFPCWLCLWWSGVCKSRWPPLGYQKVQDIQKTWNGKTYCFYCILKICYTNLKKISFYNMAANMVFF